tara:strand:+ start:964 stop:1176 length:213 start_codon:yes stop_codon:yes gene_type:complete
MSQQQILGLMKSAKVLVDFKEKKIESLQRENLELKSKLSKLETFIIELTDEDCPKEYKQIVLKELQECQN